MAPILGAFALLASGCAGPAARDDVVRVAIGGPLVSLNPALAFSFDANAVSEAIFDGLVKLDARGRVVADLATRVPSGSNGDIGAGGRTITYHLRRGVRWHDGKPFTSADVAFTFRILRDPRISGPNRAIYASVAALETPDPYTVRVRLRERSAVAVARLFCIGENGGILPAHLLAHVRDLNSSDFNGHPVGTGPYAFVSWQRASRLTLRANPAYFGGRPRIARLEIVEVADKNTLAALLKTHQVDVASGGASLIPALRDEPSLRLIVAPSRSAIYLCFNVPRPPFDDRRVRRALAFALNRERLARVVSLGTARAAESLIPPFSWGYRRDNGAPSYDPVRSAQLLDAAGWRRGSDGIRRKGGQALEIGLVTFDLPVVRKMAVLLQAAWHDVGANVSLRVVPGNVLFGNGLLAKRTYEVALLGQGFDEDPDLTNFVTSAYVPPLGENFARYRDADVDRWSAAALHGPDRAVRAPFYARIARRLNRDVPYVPLAWESTIYVVSSRLRGFQPETLNSDFWNVAQWHF